MGDSRIAKEMEKSRGRMRIVRVRESGVVLWSRASRQVRGVNCSWRGFAKEEKERKRGKRKREERGKERGKRKGKDVTTRGITRVEEGKRQNETNNKK